MSRFNQQVASKTKTTNLAGGEAYTQSPEMEFVSILLTSFASDQFYEKATASFDKLEALIPKLDAQFAAKAIVYARHKFAMRSISHVAAMKLAPALSGKPWAKGFYFSVVHRPDDITEILALAKGKMSHAMRGGLAMAFEKFDGYQLGKYKGEGKAFSLVDAVNILHPKATEKNSEALKKLVKGELKSEGTWEAALSSAGAEATTEEQKEEFKKDAWTKLVKEKKIGYLALLKNLRNIYEQAPDVLTEALDLLENEKLIKKSMVLPFRYITAFEEIQKLPSSSQVRQMMIALNKALDTAVNNVPKFNGETLVVLDESGSMMSTPMKTGGRAPALIGSLFAAVLVKSNNCDLMTFSDNARYRNVNPLDSTITLQRGITFSSGGTNFHSIFQMANKKYDRIIILSDMQGWVGHNSPTKQFSQYKKHYNCNPAVYSFDLAGHGTLQFPEQNVYSLAGFSDKVFDLMKLLETDKKALISEINKIEF